MNSSMSVYKQNFHRLEAIGRRYDIPRQMVLTSLEKKCLEISKMEQIKRLDFIKNSLEEIIQNLELANNGGGGGAAATTV